MSGKRTTPAPAPGTAAGTAGGLEPTAYSELRGAVVELFYEMLLAEQYTLGQAVARSLVEFRREIRGGGRDALVALATVFSRLARHEPGALQRFGPELGQLAALARKRAHWRGLAPAETERLREDVRFVLEKAGHVRRKA